VKSNRSPLLGSGQMLKIAPNQVKMQRSPKFPRDQDGNDVATAMRQTLATQNRPSPVLRMVSASNLTTSATQNVTTPGCLTSTSFERLSEAVLAAPTETEDIGVIQ